MLDIRKTEFNLYAVDIDGSTYEFEKWDADTGLDVLLDLTKITGKSLGLAVGGLFGDKKEGEEDGPKKGLSSDLMGQVMEALVERLDKKVCMALIKKFASEKVVCEGAKINFNSHYKDKYNLLFKVVRAGLEVQYGNFLGAVLANVGVTPPKAVTNRVF